MKTDSRIVTTPAAVSCRGIVKHFGSGSSKITALNGVSLDVHVGELLMLVGPSGCGKTTLISIIAGILNADAGECLIFNNDWEKMRPSYKTRYRGKTVGFVFQTYNLLPALTAAENVATPLLIAGLSWKKAIKEASALLDQVGLGNRTAALPAQLSGGQQQRVAIARSLAHNPKLIVCDEPTSALDHQNGEKIMELFRSVVLGANRALIVVTHDARIFSFADRIAKMDDGRITTP